MKKKVCMMLLCSMLGVTACGQPSTQQTQTVITEKHFNKKLIPKWEINIKDTLKIPCIWKLSVYFQMMGVI